MLASQQSPPRKINDLEIKDVTTFMETQNQNNLLFENNSSSGQIRQDASTCDFPAIKDIQDEAMRTRFICAVKNEAV